MLAALSERDGQESGAQVVLVAVIGLFGFLETCVGAVSEVDSEDGKKAMGWEP
jgi:hypothetical protein